MYKIHKIRIVIAVTILFILLLNILITIDKNEEAIMLKIKIFIKESKDILFFIIIAKTISKYSITTNHKLNFLTVLKKLAFILPLLLLLTIFFAISDSFILIPPYKRTLYRKLYHKKF